MKKSDLEKLSNSYARRNGRANADVRPDDLSHRAKQSLAAVSDVYQAAAQATEVVKTLMANRIATGDLSPKELLALTSALRTISSTLVEARAEARATVAELSAEPRPELDPPSPREASGVDTVHTLSANFSSPQNEVALLPTRAEDIYEEEPPRYVDDVNGRASGGYETSTKKPR